MVRQVHHERLNLTLNTKKLLFSYLANNFKWYFYRLYLSAKYFTKQYDADFPAYRFYLKSKPMNNIEEKRDAPRIDVSCKIYCQLLGSETSHKALCVTLSGTGISFIGEQAFEIDTIVEVSILTETASTPPQCFLITIARCQAIKNGMFEIGARIQLPDDRMLRPAQ